MLPQALKDRHIKQQIEDIQHNRCDGVQFEGKIEYADLKNLYSALKSNTSLDRIFFCESELGKRGLIYICDAILQHPNISFICFSNTLCSNLSSSVGKLIRMNPRITTLWLEHCELDKINLEQLITTVGDSNLQHLRILQSNINQSVILDAATQLIATNKLISLTLPLRYIDLKAGQKIAEALRHTSTLKMLRFAEEDGYIDSDALKPLLESIYHNVNLKMIRLCFGWIEGAENFQALLHFLSLYPTLQYINIANRLSKDQLQQVLDMMKNNHSLISFGRDENLPEGDDHDAAYEISCDIGEACEKNRFRGSP